MSAVPLARIRRLNEEGVNSDGDFVLYWMIAFRRGTWNFSLDRALELAKKHGKPLVILEALRCDYPWASDRIHQFVIEGMRDNAQAFADASVTYYPYLEPQSGEGKGLVRALIRRAVAVVTDDFPCFFLPRMIRAVGLRCPVQMEAIDSNGVYPMRDTDRVFSRAHYFRRHLQKHLLPHLAHVPQADPLEGVQLPTLEALPSDVVSRWPPAELTHWNGCDLARFPIDHEVTPSPVLKGGAVAAGERLASFLEGKLNDYSQRNQPEQDVSTGLSPYLHFGHISAHQIAIDVLQQAEWDPSQVAPKPNGSAHGWWHAGEAAESFLDELITWREVGYNMSCLVDNYDAYESLPEWAQTTLAEHEADPREYLYSVDEFAAGQTHDSLWNAAQNQLKTEGRMHNYLRMLWGKKILEWTPSAPTALQVMIELNNKYALDGRNPNSYSGIFWVLGRYDRAWGPERKIFGKIRYMSSENTAKKLRVKNYLAKYAGQSEE